MTKTLTMMAAAIVFLAGTIVGVRLLISGTEASGATESTCRSSVVKKGAALNSNVVRVNVFNASVRSGLANRVTINLQANGFLGGRIGNSTSKTKPRRVAILTADRKDPRVRLVASQFRDKVSYATPDIDVPSGVTVVIGNKFSGLKDNARTSIKTNRDVAVCIPIVPLP
ncbi:LytR C-terminal domain-containing protein [Aeromicrobium chenweiae]|uniref:Uncharacterized protein n=1 Tax=Aeromicrobium chenweiae TaxID=2079793 RepID=A0A2S0WHY6_9ACTN|nr:LytR C-terminal domain-containing protein [Aeromicrobium chenweiae]AWB90927.1 hypothetical protein C3E78_01060 [Aeromicrobium chenweiae]TGN32146.1 LytR family transcriptional regulator [Aeromicrobium chenweiae]